MIQLTQAAPARTGVINKGKPGAARPKYSTECSFQDSFHSKTQHNIRFGSGDPPGWVIGGTVTALVGAAYFSLANPSLLLRQQPITPQREQTDMTDYKSQLEATQKQLQETQQDVKTIKQQATQVLSELDAKNKQLEQKNQQLETKATDLNNKLFDAKQSLEKLQSNASSQGTGGDLSQIPSGTNLGTFNAGAEGSIDSVPKGSQELNLGAEGEFNINDSKPPVKRRNCYGLGCIKKSQEKSGN